MACWNVSCALIKPVMSSSRVTVPIAKRLVWLFIDNIVDRRTDLTELVVYLVSTPHALIGRFCMPYSAVRPAKI